MQFRWAVDQVLTEEEKVQLSLYMAISDSESTPEKDDTVCPKCDAVYGDDEKADMQRWL